MENPKITTYQEQVLHHLINYSSEKFPVTGSQLKKLFNIKCKGAESATIRSIVHALRQKNFPICANGYGYFYAKTDLELSKFVTRLNARISSMEEAVLGLTYAYHNIGKIAESDVRAEATKPFVTRAVRGENNTVKIMKFDLGPDGKPVIPAGIILV